MLTVISPAKRLDWSAREAPLATTEPAFAADADRLAQTARALTPEALRALMGISDRLAQLAAARFADFAPAPEAQDTRPAVFAFAGDTYAGLEARTLDADALRWAQQRLRILSGLYGLLRPLDRIQPYRLEMGTRLANSRGASLYDYWGTRLAEVLNAKAEAADTDVLVNCASKEYFAALAPSALRLRVITPVFLEERAGEAKIVSFYAKKARGAMARFICENRLSDPAALRDFDAGGYRFAPDRSTPDRPVFRRRLHDAA